MYKKRIAPLMDLTGMRFGRLVVTSQLNPKVGKRTVTCKCDCGKTTTTARPNILKGDTKSCGCLGHENRMVKAGKNPTHGMVYTSEYRAWQSLVQRCTNSKHKAWQYYGGRGIKVCKEWRFSFQTFFDHIGPKPKPYREFSIDRINNNGNYKPGNVRWATLKQQAQNKRPRKLRLTEPEGK